MKKKIFEASALKIDPTICEYQSIRTLIFISNAEKLKKRFETMKALIPSCESLVTLVIAYYLLYLFAFYIVIIIAN